MTPLERITARVSFHGDVNDPSTPRPLLSLTEFFDGNHVAGSIGCNLDPMPDPTEFREILDRISARWNVTNVLVEVTMFDDPAWPFSDTVWVVTSAVPEEVASWFDEEIRPDDCSCGWTEGVVFEPYLLPLGMQPISCWWD